MHLRVRVCALTLKPGAHGLPPAPAAVTAVRMAPLLGCRPGAKRYLQDCLSSSQLVRQVFSLPEANGGRSLLEGTRWGNDGQGFCAVCLPPRRLLSSTAQAPPHPGSGPRSTSSWLCHLSNLLNPRYLFLRLKKGDSHVCGTDTHLIVSICPPRVAQASGAWLSAEWEGSVLSPPST